MSDGAAWSGAVPPQARPILAQCLSGTLSPVMALMRLVCVHDDPDGLHAALLQARRQVDGDPAAGRLQALIDLLDKNRDGVALVRRLMGDGIEHAEAATPEAGIEAARAMFDRLALVSPEAGVALYSLGSQRILDAATAEVVAAVRACAPVAGRDVLDFGCGHGRIVAALSGEAATVTGIDVSARMVEAGRQRCTGLPNVRLVVGSGRDLAPFGGAGFDLVLAVDSFPYVVQSGMALADRHVAEFARVLRPGGDLLVFNFSYRGNLNADRRDVARLAATHGFEVVRAGTRDVALWDAATFHLRRLA